jgi:hypothetical protein
MSGKKNKYEQVLKNSSYSYDMEKADITSSKKNIKIMQIYMA